MTKSVFSDRYRQFLLVLANERQAHGVTQVELAQRLGKPQSFVSKIERGERRIDIFELQDYVNAIGISFPDFLHRMFAEKNTRL